MLIVLYYLMECWLGIKGGLGKILEKFKSYCKVLVVFFVINEEVLEDLLRLLRN